ncbi:MAG: tagatose 1,6-diphosphate aldolase [Elusimicrobiota bacterium]|nr:tagatose 1,6-diphosphate aldolase [Elusimicrobiota bacterium]
MTSATMTKPNPQLKKYFADLTPGKLMCLRQITDDKGRFKVFALDQSNSFKKALRALAEKLGKPAEPTYEQIRDCKIEMVKVLSPLSSAVLLDVNFGARQALNSLAFPKTVGLIVRSEASKDAGIPSEYEPGWSVEKIKKMGAAAVKLLVYLDVEDKNNTKAQLAFVEKLSKACREQDILLMTEELSFPRKGEDKKTPAYKARKVNNIIEATKLIGPHTDILKLEYPANMGDDSEQQQVENLGRLNEAAMRPWVLLSAGERFDVFAKQVELAMKAGCSGYMAGRAIFNEYFEQPTAAARHNFLQTTAMDRMKLLNKSVEAHSPSWMQRYGIAESELAAAVSPTWYLSKGETAGKGGATEGAY